MLAISKPLRELILVWRVMTCPFGLIGFLHFYFILHQNVFFVFVSLSFDSIELDHAFYRCNIRNDAPDRPLVDTPY